MTDSGDLILVARWKIAVARFRGRCVTKENFSSLHVSVLRSTANTNISQQMSKS